MLKHAVMVVVGVVMLGWPTPAAEVVTFEALTISTSAVGLATATHSPTGQGEMVACLGRLESAAVRFRIDGTNPTADEGVLLKTDETLTIDSHADMRRIRFIRDDASDGTLRIHCWR